MFKSLKCVSVNICNPVGREVKDILFEVLSKVSYPFINKKMCVMLNTLYKSLYRYS